MSYTDINFPTKKSLKEAIAAGRQIKVYNPGLGGEIHPNAKVVIEGPHGYHKYYAQGQLKDGYLVSIK